MPWWPGIKKGVEVVVNHESGDPGLRRGGRESGERDGGRSSSTALRWAWCRVVVIGGRRPPLLWFAVRSCGSRCRVVVVGGRRSFDGSGVGRDWVGQRRELKGSTVRSRTDFIFRADENEERGTVRFYGFLGLVSHSHSSTQKSMCAVTQFLCGSRASSCGPRAYAGQARSGLPVQFSSPPRVICVGLWAGPLGLARIATPNPNFHNLESDFVSEGGQKRVYLYEAANVKADFDIAQACHTDTKIIIN